MIDREHNFRLTKAEKDALELLEELEEVWPDSLWLFSASGSLEVMRVTPSGKVKMTGAGGVDPAYSIARVEIPNDGGDW